jgi:hypothetical protein
MAAPSARHRQANDPMNLIDDMVAVLRTVEWAAETDADEGGRVDACPCCGSEKRGGHSKHCSLAAVLARATAV